MEAVKNNILWAPLYNIYSHIFTGPRSGFTKIAIVSGFPDARELTAEDLEKEVT